MNTTYFARVSLLRSSLFVIMTSLLFACASPTMHQQFDFGVSQTEDNQKTSNATNSPKLAILLAEIQVPNSLEGTSMLYRLLYENKQELRPYAQSRWSMPPAQLLKQRIKTHINQQGGAVLTTSDGVKNLPILRIELEEFSQHFSSPQQSQVQLRWRASLIKQNQLIAQKIFQAQTTCDSADAKGGAKAMPQASDRTITELIAWLQTQVR
ncbi:ABC-type transport auxiliary lipoprotein family protein [Undibacterium baiyunense]|uniref:Membrane integrity-associated transporter subunit PqiC n=1 Tax=Undibacterium baiyunense TaxID=2828731 RepID=A0A941I5Y9_9BURK|nr:ABC-type transport auxiliary lipoprotein family protein [Undibacterium baiyunense]MBR7748429.1 membrane integrity-associated transporter subunit PqiC [Undibacterium baiyunense]